MARIAVTDGTGQMVFLDADVTTVVLHLMLREGRPSPRFPWRIETTAYDQNSNQVTEINTVQADDDERLELGWKPR
jgi:hypothetical protein